MDENCENYNVSSETQESAAGSDISDIKDELQSDTRDDIQNRVPMTYIVTETKYNHTNTYTGPDTRADEAYDTRGTAGAEGSAKTTARKDGIRMSALKLVAICLVCSILGAVLSIAGYKLFTGNERTSVSTAVNATDKPGTANSELSLSDNATSSPETQQVVINVDTETVSPAAAVAAKVLPSIVGIQVKVTSTSYWYGTTTSGSEGSGVILSDDGYIVTNYHVISSMLTTAGETNPNASLSVFLYTDPENAIEGSVIGYDQGTDLAVIKINKTGLTAIDIGDSDEIHVGDTAIAIGNPGGLQFLGSVSQGIISGLNRSIQIDTTYQSIKLIQTDAAINPGNSGGALTDVSGRLIGINSAKIAIDNYEGMGFAIPVNDMVRICTDIIKNGNVKAAYLGVELNSQYSASYLEQLGYPGGLLVKSVISGSPADKAGIESDDIIISFNGTNVRTAEELAALKNKCASGDKVVIRIYRLTSSRFGHWTGDYYNVEVTLG